MSLWLARHAQPLLAPGTCYGALDVPADAARTQQAAQALAQALPPTLHVAVSPRKRCLQLAEALQSLRPALSWTISADLREMDFGIWEGVPWTDIPRQAIDDWTQDFAQHRFGGKESANEVLQRVAQAWDAAALQNSVDTLWITHAGVVQAARLLAQGVRRVERASDWPSTSLPYGEWLKLSLRKAPASFP